MNNKSIALILCLTLFLLTGLSGVVGASESACNPLGESDFCVEEVVIPDENVEEGDIILTEVTVSNVGESVASVRVVQGLDHPEGHSYSKFEDIENLEPGESTTISSEGQVINSGYREINIMLLNERETHLYDSTGYEYSYIANGESSNNGILSSLSLIHYIITGIAAGLTILGYLSTKRR